MVRWALSYESPCFPNDVCAGGAFPCSGTHMTHGEYRGVMRLPVWSAHLGQGSTGSEVAITVVGCTIGGTTLPRRLAPSNFLYILPPCFLGIGCSDRKKSCQRYGGAGGWGSSLTLGAGFFLPPPPMASFIYRLGSRRLAATL